MKIKFNPKNLVVFSVQDFFVMILLVAAACMVSNALLMYTGIENNSALIHILAVVVISRLTQGMLYGVLASIASAFLVNYYFMYPYASFNFTLRGYLLTFACMIVVSCIVSAMTWQIKDKAQQAEMREKQTRELAEINERLIKEQAEIKMEAEKEKTRSNLLRAVSHDLRTPLTSVMGATSVLLESGQYMAEEERRKFLQDIYDDADWLVRMVENLLSVTRINSTEAASVKKQVEAAEEIVSESLQKIKKRFPQQKISVYVPDDLLLVPMDAMLIEQVLINLMENAIRHSGDKENIELRVARHDQYAVFAVSDAGKGLNDEVFANLSAGRDFYTDFSADSTRGTGIGLSVCQNIIKAHGGVLEAENNANGGATFRFGLPLEEMRFREEQTNDFSG